HETLAATVIGEVLQIDPDRIRIVRPDSLASLPGNSPVGSRMAIMLGGAAFHAAEKLKCKLMAIAAPQFGFSHQAIYYPPRAVPARLGRTRPHRESHLSPFAAGFRARARGAPGDEGADRHRAADPGRPGTDVSVPLVRTSSRAGRNRSRARQAAVPPLRDRAR